MNDLARNVIVDAALKNVPQIKGRLSDGQGGFCVVGVLLNAAFGTASWGWDFYSQVKAFDLLYETNKKERSALVEANNEKGWDFLTIARKFGGECTEHEP